MGDEAFKFINSILDTKLQLIVDEDSEKGYQPFLTNRAMSQHLDLALVANEMNIHNHIDAKLQFDFLLYSVKKMFRRYKKWPKKEEDKELILTLSQYFNCSYKRAKEYEKILTSEQQAEIEKVMDVGGTS